MSLNINSFLNTATQPTLSYGERLIGIIQKNNIVFVALVALGCLAIYLYKRVNNQPAQLAVKTPQPINTDQTEAKTPSAKTQNVFQQAISQDKNHQEDKPVTIQENQEENKVQLPSPPSSPSPLPSPKEKKGKILDEKIENIAPPVSDPTPDPIKEDPIELHGKLIETTDDLIHFLNEKSSFESAEAIRRNDPDYLANDFFIAPLERERLEKKFNISLVEFAVRHVKARMNRMYLAHTFNMSYISILDTSLTKDEIIDFLKDIEGSDLHKQYGAPFVNLRQYSSPFLGKVLDSIFPGTGGKEKAQAANFKEKNTKGIAIFKEFFADRVVKSDTKFKQLFINCLKDHNPELLQALFDQGYQDPVLPVTNKELELKKLTKRQKAVVISKNRQRQKELLTYLKVRNSEPGYYKKPSTYNDYDRLKETINLLIKNNFLELETFGVQSSHDLIIQEFRPDNFVVLNMLESPQCDLQTLTLLARTYQCIFSWEFESIMERAVEAIENPNQFQNSLLACQFLHDHYSHLEDDMKKALAEVLQNPDYMSVKQRYFDDLGF